MYFNNVSMNPSLSSDLVTYLVIAVVLVIFFVKKSRDKSRMGINLKRIYCPNCNAKQPFIRVPKNERQALWGGHTCSNCGIEMDKYGGEIKK